jgi:phosphate transport system protein
VADDLREIVGAIRAAGDLERVGDLAKNIAKRSIKIGLNARAPRAIVGLRHMNEVATELLKDVLDAFAQRDVEHARAVWERDVELDALEDSVFRDLLTHMMEDPRNISFCTHLLFCSKNIERIGDHGLSSGDGEDCLLLDLALQGVEPEVRCDHLLRERSVGIRERIHGVDDHFFGDPAHLDDAPCQRVEFLVVGFDGVVDHDFRLLGHISG